MHLNSVVFPHPEGPIKAVTQFCLKSISIFFSASFVPNQAFNEEMESLYSLLLFEIEDSFLGEGKEEDLVSGFLLCEDFKILNNKITYNKTILESGYNIHYLYEIDRAI